MAREPRQRAHFWQPFRLRHAVNPECLAGEPISLGRNAPFGDRQVVMHSVLSSSYWKLQWSLLKCQSVLVWSPPALQGRIDDDAPFRAEARPDGAISSLADHRTPSSQASTAEKINVARCSPGR
ncbi:hypothetical protein CORC01_10914 [Colletotrichum orchidophilum]|uniref:Uncharacterized protein n=1 Tax=Colletotrichum orchidophilum TaxID=1209926 RepID=A0A1G4AX94_9PEZI|nr:uncharacterized protein CORC01_10914 [Colletotrichum orchidophilum]OHE93788.1 hypothetical protein CORC01_10914 [Colletotrichum orchidophilum]